MAGIQIGIASETKAFKQGIETGLIDPLEDAVEALEDLGKSKGPDKLEDGFEDAQKASKKLEKEVKETADTIEDEFRSSYSKMKKSSKDATDEASEGMEELKTEGLQTATETAASFDGSAESIVGAFQEVSAKAFAGFGPAGAAAGLAAAAGIGLVGAAFTQTSEDAEEMAERTADAFEKMLEAKSTYFTQEQILDEMRELIKSEEEMNNITKDALAAGVSTSTMLRARAGDVEALATVQGELTKRYKENADAMAEEGPIRNRMVGGIHTTRDALNMQSQALDQVTERLDSQAAINSKAADAYRLYSDAATSSTFANDQALASVDNLSDGVNRLGSGLREVPKETNPHVTVTYDIDKTALLSAINQSFEVNVNGYYTDRQGRRMRI